MVISLVTGGRRPPRFLTFDRPNVAIWFGLFVGDKQNTSALRETKNLPGPSYIILKP